MERWTVPFAVCIAVSIGAVLSLASGGQFSVVLVVLSAGPAMLMAASIAYSRSLSHSAGLLNEAFACMSEAGQSNAVGVPLPLSLSKSSLSCKDLEVQAVMLRSSRMMLMGRDASQSIRAACARMLSKPGAPKGSVFYEKLLGMASRRPSSISQLVSWRDEELSSRHADLPGTAQRHATMNMFLSAIAPSFAIFMFIGGLITSGSSGGMLQLGEVLLIAVPVSYSMANAFMARRLFG